MRVKVCWMTGTGGSVVFQLGRDERSYPSGLGIIECTQIRDWTFGLVQKRKGIVQEVLV